jgi:hypothetical protein
MLLKPAVRTGPCAGVPRQRPAGGHAPNTCGLLNRICHIHATCCRWNYVSPRGCGSGMRRRIPNPHPCCGTRRVPVGMAGGTSRVVRWRALRPGRHHRPGDQPALGRWCLATQAAYAGGPGRRPTVRGLAAAPCRRLAQASRSLVLSVARRSPRAAGRGPRRRQAGRPSPGRRAGQPDARRHGPGQVQSAHRPWRARCRVQRMLPQAIAAMCSLARLRLRSWLSWPPPRGYPCDHAQASVEPAQSGRAARARR